MCFDFDQTLAYIERGHLALYVQAAAEHGVAVTQEALAAQPLGDVWAPWMTPLGPDHRAASADEGAFRALREGLHVARLRGAGVDADEGTLAGVARRIADLEGEPDHYRLFDDALPALERLARAGVPAVIVSNHVWRLPEIVVGLGCGARVEGVLTSARVGVRKPHPEIFRAALRLTGTAPGETLMVGDSLRDDVEGARGVGMQGALIDRRGRAGAPEGTALLRSLLEVPLA